MLNTESIPITMSKTSTRVYCFKRIQKANGDECTLPVYLPQKCAYGGLS